MRPELTQEQIDYFLTGIDFAFFWENDERASDWRAIRDDLLRDFVQEHPGHRPFFWWATDAPGPRLRVGGIGDVVPAYDIPTNLHFGMYRRSAFVSERLLAAVAPIGDGLISFDENDPPRYESQAAYLKRHDLFLPGEEKRLSETDYKPEVIR